LAVGRKVIKLETLFLLFTSVQLLIKRINIHNDKSLFSVIGKIANYWDFLSLDETIILL